MVFIFISSIISMIIVMYRVNKSEAFLEKIRDYEKINKRKMNKGKVPISFYLKYCGSLLLVLLFVMVVYINAWAIGEMGVNLSISLSVCLISLFIADLFWEKWKVRLYYDKEGFFIKSEYIRFNNVKEIKKLKKGNYSLVILKNGKELKIKDDLANQIIYYKNK